MAAQAAPQQTTTAQGPQTGQVWGINEHAVIIEGIRYVIPGDIKTDAAVKDMVTFEVDEHRIITKIAVIERGNNQGPPPETQPAGPGAEEKKPAKTTAAKKTAKPAPQKTEPQQPAAVPTMPAWQPPYCHGGKDGCNFFATGGFCGKKGEPISNMKACPAPREGSGTPPAAVTRQAEADRTSEMLGQAVQDVKAKAAQGAPAGQQAPEQDPPAAAAGTGQSAPVQQPAAGPVQTPPNTAPAQQSGTGKFRKATRKAAKLRLGLVGPAGSGKTWDALNIALGIGGRIAVVDTENSSAELYSHLGAYDILIIQAPFTVQKYIDAIRAAEREGYDIIILDSITHAWSGEGGLLDVKDQIVRNSKSGNSWAAWKDVTPLHTTFVEAMLQSKCHIIATMRSKTEYILDYDDRGRRQVPRKVGMAPIQRDGMDYEFTLVFDIDAAHIATASKDRTSLFTGKAFQPSLETGRQLKAWLDGGGA